MASQQLHSFADRRREQRKSIEFDAFLKPRNWFGKKLEVSVVNKGLSGLSIRSAKSGFKAGSKAFLLVPFGDNGHQFKLGIQCRWQKYLSGEIEESGWLIEPAFRDVFERIIESSHCITDGRNHTRRTWTRRSESASQSQDLRKSRRRLSDFPVRSPLEFDPADLPYRGQSDRRQMDRRLADVSVSPERRNNGDRRRSENRTSRPIPPIVVKHSGRTTLRKVLSAFRDYLVLWLPSRISQKMVPEGEFAFITHPRDVSDVQRQFPLAKYLPEKLINLWLRYQWPVSGVRVKGIRDRHGKELNGWLLFCPLTARQMIRNRELAQERVFQTVKLASKMGVKIVGLGAFTSIVTKDGLEVADRFPIHVTSGNALSAAGAIQNVAAACHYAGMNLADATVGIVGAGGNVGSVCAKILSEKAKKLILVDVNQRALNSVCNEIKRKSIIQTANNPEPIREADIVIAVTNAPGAILKAHHLKPGAIVIDAAQPKNVSETVPQQRNDVLVIESSILHFPGIQYGFDLGIGKSEALGCMAETIVLSGAQSKKNYSIGKITPEQVNDIYTAAKILGVRIGYFRTSEGLVHEDRLRNVAAAKRKS